MLGEPCTDIFRPNHDGWIDAEGIEHHASAETLKRRGIILGILAKRISDRRCSSWSLPRCQLRPQ